MTDENRGPDPRPRSGGQKKSDAEISRRYCEGLRVRDGGPPLLKAKPRSEPFVTRVTDFDLFHPFGE
jgi:hypothetical protein